MSPIFIILAAVTLAGAIGAMTLRKLVHCALSAAVSFAGVGLLFVELGAEFAGWAQILVYVGAIAVLIVFAILLTRGSEAEGAATAASPVAQAARVSNTLTQAESRLPPPGSRVRPGRWWAVGLLVAMATLAGLLLALARSPSLARLPQPAPTLTVKMVGMELMSKYLLPLEVVGLLLTAAMVGAVVMAMQEKGKR